MEQQDSFSFRNCNIHSMNILCILASHFFPSGDPHCHRHGRRTMQNLVINRDEVRQG